MKKSYVFVYEEWMGMRESDLYLGYLQVYETNNLEHKTKING